MKEKQKFERKSEDIFRRMNFQVSSTQKQWLRTKIPESISFYSIIFRNSSSEIIGILSFFTLSSFEGPILSPASK
jgi:hypothetical protein